MVLPAYIGLFLAAFLAATILPAQSESVLATLIVMGGHSPWMLLAVASAGNVLGSIVNWALGRGIDRVRNKKWFPVKQETLEKAQGWYRRYGRWSLLLSWVPFIGDPITVAAGVMREKFWVFLALVTIAKTGRYLVLVITLLSALTP